MTNNRIRAGLIAGTALPLTVLTGVALAQTVSIDQLTNDEGINIEGEVSDVFGNRFVLDDGSGRVLVETGPERGQEYNIEEGEQLTVYGEPDADGSSFDAFRIVREDGSEIEVRRPNGPPPWAGKDADRGGPERAGEPGPRGDGPRGEGPPGEGPRGEGPRAEGPRGEDRRGGAGDARHAQMRDMLSDAGFTDLRLDEEKGRHVEYDARDAEGRAVEIEVFFDGAIKKLEFDDDQRAALSDYRALLPAAVLEAADERQLVEIEEFETKGRHYEIEGYDAGGREVEIEIDFDGRIRKVEIDDGNERRAEAPRVDGDDLRNRVEDAGYRFEGDIERKPRHFEVAASNPEGEPVELHIDFDGEIYKEQLRR